MLSDYVGAVRNGSHAPLQQSACGHQNGNKSTLASDYEIPVSTIKRLPHQNTNNDMVYNPSLDDQHYCNPEQGQIACQVQGNVSDHEYASLDRRTKKKMTVQLT